MKENKRKAVKYLEAAIGCSCLGEEIHKIEMTEAEDKVQIFWCFGQVIEIDVSEMDVVSILMKILESFD